MCHFYNTGATIHMMNMHMSDSLRASECAVSNYTPCRCRMLDHPHSHPKTTKFREEWHYSHAQGDARMCDFVWPVEMEIFHIENGKLVVARHTNSDIGHLVLVWLFIVALRHPDWSLE